MKYYIFCNIALKESKINILHPISTEIDKIRILSMSFMLVICLTFFGKRKGDHSLDQVGLIHFLRELALEYMNMKATFVELL